MKSARLLALHAALPLLALLPLASHATTDATPGQRLSDDELSQVHAAGLPDPSLQRLSAGLPLAPDEFVVAQQLNGRDLSLTVDRQQAIAQTRLAATTAQTSLGLMQVATWPTLFTPVAPLFLPTLAMPFPFFMLPPPKKPDFGH